MCEAKPIGTTAFITAVRGRQWKATKHAVGGLRRSTSAVDHDASAQENEMNEVR
jgi:hypothetical protein